MDLPTMRARLRADLRDEDAANERWSDDTLDRHIARAVQELSLAAPREATATLEADGTTRDLDIATLADRVTIEAVEYPTSQYPPAYPPFSVWGDTLTLLVDAAPGDGESVLVYWRALHTIDPSGSTVPAWAERLMVQGAAGYAALEWASLATNRVNVGGEETWRRYLEWGKERLAAFHQGLDGLRRRQGLRSRQLYTPAAGKPGQSTDWGP